MPEFGVRIANERFTPFYQMLRFAPVEYRIIMASLALISLNSSALAQGLVETRDLSTQRAELGQFMTPEPIARFMATQFDTLATQDIRLLDAGAGQGALSLAFAERWAKQKKGDQRLDIDAYELDPEMIRILQANLGSWDRLEYVSTSIVPGDFIAHAVAQIQRGDRSYTHAILNPPYKKISSHSSARRLMASVGIETVNLYSGFVALALELLEPEGELVAIVPRSFCNGPYYKSFRRFMLERAAIESIHLFAARDQAFSGDSVLQENVIIRLRKGAAQKEVVVTTSKDAGFNDLTRRSIPFAQIVFPSDREQFIHIPVVENGNLLAALDAYRSKLADIDLSVSTGPVVDFRLKRHLRTMPARGDVPLLYPGHFVNGRLEWPRQGFKKANAIAFNADTARWLYPAGFYVVVRRFSSKEEKRRIVASLVDPNLLPKTPMGFENHLNVFHINRGPLPEDIARGLTVYLNAKVVDDWFRQFNGHTQVNATDLRALPYPDRARLTELGRWNQAHPNASAIEIDRKIEQLP